MDTLDDLNEKVRLMTMSDTGSLGRTKVYTAQDAPVLGAVKEPREPATEEMEWPGFWYFKQDHNGRKVCGEYHLLGYCDRPEGCAYIHEEVKFTERALKAVRMNYKSLPCPEGINCTRPRCIKGHSCRYGTSCIKAGKGCWFDAEQFVGGGHTETKLTWGASVHETAQRARNRNDRKTWQKKVHFPSRDFIPLIKTIREVDGFYCKRVDIPQALVGEDLSKSFSWPIGTDQKYYSLRPYLEAAEKGGFITTWNDPKKSPSSWVRTTGLLENLYNVNYAGGYQRGTWPELDTSSY